MTTNPNRRGAEFERELLPWLRVLWPTVRRTGKGFEGPDFLNTPGFAIEAKRVKDMRLAAWMKQAELYREQFAEMFAVVIHKRRFFGTHGAYVTMSLEQWVAMIAMLRGVDLPEDLYPVSDPDEDRPEWA